MKKQHSPSAANIDAKATEYLAAQKEVARLRTELSDLVRAVGKTPHNAEKTMLLEGAGYDLRLSTRTETHVDTAGALALAKACPPKIFEQLFSRVDKFVVCRGAHKFVSLLPGKSGTIARERFYAALDTKEMGSQLKVTKRKQK
jgi:hypothetical protein